MRAPLQRLKCAPKTIRHRLTIAFLGLALVPLILAGASNAALFYRHYTKAELEHLQELSLRVAAEVEQVLRAGEHALFDLQAYRNFLALPLAEQRELLGELLARHGFREVSLLDRSGRERIRLSDVEVVLPTALHDHGSEAQYLQPLRSGQPYYGEIVHDELTAEPLLTVSVPVLNIRTGTVEAVLSAELRFKQVWDLIARLDPGHGTVVYLLDENGWVVAHRNPSVVLRGTRTAVPDTPAVGVGIGGAEAFMASGPIRVGSRVFQVVAEHNWWAGIAPAIDSLLLLLSFLLVALALALGGGAYVLRRVVRPIDSLEQTARAIAEGDLSRRVEVMHDDEVGALGRSFNHMTERLLATRTMLQTVIDTIPLHVFWKDREARYLGCNERFARSAGLHGATEIIAKSDWNLAWREQAELYRRDDFAVMEAGEPRLDYEEPQTTGEGNTIWLRTSKVPLRDADGEVVGVLGVYQDITAQKEAEARLARATAEWDYAMDFYDDAIYLLDLEQRVVRANRAFYRLTHSREGEVIGRRIAAIMHPQGESVPCPVCRLLEEQRETTIVLEADHPDNSTGRPLEVNSRLIRDRDGTPTGTLMTVRDLSRARQTEQRLRQAAAVFESTQEGVMITDAEVKLVAVNQAFTRITGYEEREVVGKVPSLLQSGHHPESFYQAMWMSIRETGSWQGELWNRRKGGEVFPSWLAISTITNDAGEIINYVGVFSDISSLKRSQEELEHLAHHDPLTGLPNRLLFRARLEHALQRAVRSGGQLAVLFLDLDGFKHVNDSLGHTAGDSLLQEVAKRLAAPLRREDTVARLGGDEFTVLLEGIHGRKSAARVAETLIRALAEPIRLQGRELFVSASVGISLFPRDGDSVEALLRNADAAMYEAKEGGRNTCRFYTEELTALAFERVVMEGELRRAIEKGELMLHYQPQVDLPTGRLVGLEALVRWDHPVEGLVAPSRFIPIAEQSGLIVPLGNWVLHTACQQAKAWLDAGHHIGRVSVNVAGRQIQRTDLVTTVRDVLARTQLPPDHLELEITEGFIMGQAEESVTLLKSLRALGVGLSIDDFGTGYSSLAYLKRLPIDKLKIDRSFVRELPDDENDAAIARAVIALGHSLQFTVIAEGVETAAQRDFLLTLGCDQGQGFLFSTPRPAEMLTPLLIAHSSQEGSDCRTAPCQ